MKILVVGGTGAIGAYAALHLQGQGHAVVVSARNEPAADSPLSKLGWMQGNYLENTYTEKDLSGFEAIVFAAGSDMRHVPAGEDEDQHYLHANGVAVPEFAKLARDAGVKAFVHTGSFYPQVVPEMIDSSAYVKSRHLADKGVCQLANEDFVALSLNAPFVVGYPKGISNPMFTAYVNYAKGRYPNIEPFGPAGGSNFMSVHSLAQAIEGALERGVGGTSYLVGDENLSFAEFFAHFFQASGNKLSIPSRDQEHPMLPDVAIIPGRGSVVSYEPDAEETALLGYQRNDIARVVEEIVTHVNQELGEVEPIEMSSSMQSEPELERLTKVYAHAMDSNKPELLSEIMTEDIAILGPGFNFASLDNVLAIPGQLKMFYRQTNHSIHQQLFEITGDSAVGETYCTAKHLLHPEGEGISDRIMLMEIRYHDRFIRESGAWKFSKRSLLVDWMEVSDVSIAID